MRMSRILLVVSAIAMPAVPVAAQTKTGTSTTVAKSTTRAKAVRTTRSVARNAVASAPEPVIEMPVDGKIVLSSTLKARLNSLLAGSTMSYDEAVTGWRNHGQLVAAMNAANNRNLSFAAIHHEVVTNHMYVVDAVATVRGASATTATQ